LIPYPKTRSGVAPVGGKAVVGSDSISSKSLVVAVTITPVLCLFLLRNASLTGKISPLSEWLGRVYVRMLARATNTPAAAYITVAVITLAGVAVWPMLGYSLLPPFKERDFLIHWITDPSTSHPEMLRITKLVSKELRAIPGVRNFGAHIGQAFLADEIVGVANGENWISIDPNVDYDKTIAAIKEVVDGYPGLYRGVETYLDERIEEVLTGESEPIVVRIFGSDLAVLRQQAEVVRQALSGINGIAEVKKDINVDVPHIQVTVKPAEALRDGLKPGDVRRASAVLMAGEEVGDIFYRGRTYDVQLWTTPEWRHSLTSVEQMLIDTPTGKRVLRKCSSPRPGAGRLLDRRLGRGGPHHAPRPRHQHLRANSLHKKISRLLDLLFCIGRYSDIDISFVTLFGIRGCRVCHYVEF
jgi:Cu/Ag efflux pump CusA